MKLCYDDPSIIHACLIVFCIALVSYNITSIFPNWYRHCNRVLLSGYQVFMKIFNFRVGYFNNPRLY